MNGTHSWPTLVGAREDSRNSSGENVGFGVRVHPGYKTPPPSFIDQAIKTSDATQIIGLPGADFSPSGISYVPNKFVNRRTTALVLAALLLTLGALLLAIRYRTDQILFPPVVGASTARIVGSMGAPRSSTGRMLLRGYGEARLGCVVFFPGQHGGIATYEKKLFPSFVSHGIKVFSASYPGQDGAPGTADIAEVHRQASPAVVFASQECGASHTVVLGRSLGSMVAAYSIGPSRAAGLILVSAAPSLSAAFSAQLRSHWYMWPLRLLPAHALLRRDFSLAGALGPRAAVPLLIFQGTLDLQTPLELLQSEGAIPGGARIVVVPGGTHADTYVIANRSIVEAVKALLTRHKANNPPKPTPARGAT